MVGPHMKLSRAAVLEATAAERKPLVAALSRAGLKASGARSPEELSREQLVLVASGARQPAKLARAVRQRLPEVVVLAAQKSLVKPSWADAVVPLPVSPRDLTVRLPEWLALKAAQRGPSVEPRPGEGILDPLTGFYTFAHFKEVLFIEVKRARRYGFPLAGALIAVDPLGTELSASLREQLVGGIALAIRRSLRDTDYPVQYNPDHALALMPHTDLQGALVVSQRICDRVAHATLAEGDHILKPTVSIGVAGSQGGGNNFSFADLARNAQESLAVAQQKGGNRVEFFDAAAPNPGASGGTP
jgi:diguanylate cyclase (GGDEF)-like protein